MHKMYADEQTLINKENTDLIPIGPDVTSSLLPSPKYTITGPIEEKMNGLEAKGTIKNSSNNNTKEITYLITRQTIEKGVAPRDKKQIAAKKEELEAIKQQKKQLQEDNEAIRLELEKAQKRAEEALAKCFNTFFRKYTGNSHVVTFFIYVLQQVYKINNFTFNGDNIKNKADIRLKDYINQRGIDDQPKKCKYVREEIKNYLYVMKELRVEDPERGLIKAEIFSTLQLTSKTVTIGFTLEFLKSLKFNILIPKTAWSIEDPETIITFITIAGKVQRNSNSSASLKKAYTTMLVETITKEGILCNVPDKIEPKYFKRQIFIPLLDRLKKLADESAFKEHYSALTLAYEPPGKKRKEMQITGIGEASNIINKFIDSTDSSDINKHCKIIIHYTEPFHNALKNSYKERQAVKAKIQKRKNAAKRRAAAKKKEKEE